MGWLAFIVILLSAVSATPAQENSVQRPPILGISHVRFHVTRRDAALHFYQDLLGMTPEKGLCENEHLLHLTCLWIGNGQFVQLDSLEQRRPSSQLEEVAFATPDVEGMSKFLLSRGFTYDLVAGHELIVKDGAGRIVYFSVLDPEGNRIVFEQPPKGKPAKSERQVSRALIHAGFVVRDRATLDRFYKDILGFHLYWQGGRKDDETDFVNMQVPDGTDWIEYMLNVPADADHHTLGGVNHIALGVPDIKAAREQLIKNGWKPGEEPKIGRGGKWMLNLYDPDDTRVEFMEFTPTQKPCCSEFTGPHPGPKQ
jgi:catechol 2,3-dioxygenase-like lactoylglutathione lyase family enzyme